MRFVIREKPLIVTSLTAVLGANTRNNGYFEGNGYLVSYCYRRLLGLAAPDLAVPIITSNISSNSAAISPSPSPANVSRKRPAPGRSVGAKYFFVAHLP
ncbi:MAG: hypothetical protein LBH54_04470 [Clostridiales bacterium]|jgi:hypothetical protein|nr:hypothetical protein [Clostridiales bacterium]